jgi:hypothetical protein
MNCCTATWLAYMILTGPDQAVFVRCTMFFFHGRIVVPACTVLQIRLVTHSLFTFLPDFFAGQGPLPKPKIWSLLKKGT